MGMSDKTQKSTQNTVQNSTATTTPNVPDWLLQPAQTAAGGLSKLLATDPTSFAPTESALQKQATTSAGNLSVSPLLGQAATQVNAIAPVQGQSLLDGLDRYYTPFKDQVLNPVLSDFDHQSGVVRAGQSAKEAATGSFRGSRSGIAQAATEGELARGRASTEGGLLSDMYGQATTLSGQDAARRQEAMTGNADRSLSGAGLLANIGATEGSQALANEQAQANQGANQTTIDNAMHQAPITTQAQLEGLLSGLDPAMYSGSTVNSNGTSNTTGKTVTSDPMGGLGTAAMLAATLASGGAALPFLSAGGGAAGMGAIVSDERLKRDAVQVGVRADGLKLWLYRYLWSPIWRIGVMAQEVLKVRPDAVINLPCGYMAVDYGALG